MKILVCFGTRPEAIKMASLVQRLKSSPAIDVRVCVTAQHRQMLDQVLDFFEIVPDYDLDVMKQNQSLNELCGRIFLKIDPVLQDYRPDVVLVHGDTTTSTVCAWAAFHRNIKIGHVEAGLRTFDKFSPFPEELNRQLSSRICDYHFAPTTESGQNLLDEGIEKNSILITGNTVIDSLLWGVSKLNSGYSNTKIAELKSTLDFSKKIILVTGHRRENFGQGFLNICSALAQLAKNNDIEIVYPVHLNPQVQQPVQQILSGIPNVHLIAPLDYPSFIWMMQQAYFIITDSGGVQEEAPSLGKPVLVMRETTERPEAVREGTVLLVGTDPDKIREAAQNLLDNHVDYEMMSRAHNPYGDGEAAMRILNFFENSQIQG